MKKVSCDSSGIKVAAKSIQTGGIVVYPTDTVYGIGCDPYNSDAINRIYEIKKRDKTKLFPILGYSKQVLENIVEFNEMADTIAKKFWPGQLTIILPIKDEKLQGDTNNVQSIGVRVPNNRCVLSLLKECKLIIGTSANISGKETITDPNKFDEFNQDFDIFLDGGKIQSSGASTIIEIKNDELKIIRKGSISEHELRN